jgi:hypothetical protein
VTNSAGPDRIRWVECATWLVSGLCGNLIVQREYASAIAAAKGLGDTPGGLYVGNTATTEKAGWNHF